MPQFRVIASKIHLYAGLTLGIIITVISVTGSALVFRDEIDRLLRPDLLQVTPIEERVSLEEIVRQVEATITDGRPSLIEMPRNSEDPYTVWLAPDNRHAFVNPYSGHILGVRGRYEGLMGTLFALHVYLLAGATGAWIVGMSGLLLVLLSLTGLILWWPGWRRIRIGLLVIWRRGWRRLNYDLHRAGGFWTVAFLVLTAATGSALIFYQTTGEMLNWLTGSEAVATPPTSRVQPDGTPVSLDAALQSARKMLPEAKATFVYIPAQPQDPITVRMRTPQEWHPNGRSFVYVDRYSGELLRVDDARQAPLGSRIAYTFYPLHIGSIGGFAVGILYVILGLAPAVLSVTGTVIWYTRWRKKWSRQPSYDRVDAGVQPVAAELPGRPG